MVVCLVYWELKTPVVFGDSATLTCIVDQDNNCDSAATRRWDGGRNNTILMLNGHSTNASKYNEVADEPCHNFSLIIMDFGMNDFTDYKCTFEFQTSRQTLTLDARYFIGTVCFSFFCITFLFFLNVLKYNCNNCSHYSNACFLFEPISFEKAGLDYT